MRNPSDRGSDGLSGIHDSRNLPRQVGMIRAKSGASSGLSGFFGGQGGMFGSSAVISLHFRVNVMVHRNVYVNGSDGWVDGW